MKLSEMSRKQLEKVAEKYGVVHKKIKSDDDLRVAINAAKKEKGKEGGSLWPEGYNTAMLDEYFKFIVGRPRSGNDEKDYKTIAAVIDERAKTEKPLRTAVGPDCRGISYTAGHQTCMICPVAPLCKHICETRPGEFLALLNSIDEAAKQAGEVGDDDAQAAIEATDKKKVAKKAKPKKEEKAEEKAEKEAPSAAVSKSEEKRRIIYTFTGDLSQFGKDVVDDKDLRKVYEWMAGRGDQGFTRSELAAQLGKHFEDGLLLAKDTLNFLKELDSLSKRVEE